jgi:molybdate transport repressor ModE-like protein
MHSNEAQTNRAARNPWLGVELRHMAALAAVAREGSFRGAADSLGYVQSAVSQQVAYLERIVGQRLVERVRGGTTVLPTAAGELLLDHVGKLLAELGAAQADFEELAEGGAGRLRLGACSSLAAGILARVLPGLRRRAPALQVEAVEASAKQLAAQVANGSLDVAFAELPLPEGPFVSTKLCTDSYLLLARRESFPDLLDTRLSLAEVTALPLLGHPFMDKVEHVLRAAGMAPRYELWCESLPALQALVGAGAGCAIVPRLLMAASSDDRLAVPLDVVLPPRHICAFRHSGRISSRTAELVVEHAAWVCGPLGADIRPAAPWVAAAPAAVG